MNRVRNASCNRKDTVNYVVSDKESGVDDK